MTEMEIPSQRVMLGSWLVFRCRFIPSRRVSCVSNWQEGMERGPRLEDREMEIKSANVEVGEISIIIAVLVLIGGYTYWYIEAWWTVACRCSRSLVYCPGLSL